MALWLTKTAINMSESYHKSYPDHPSSEPTATTAPPLRHYPENLAQQHRKEWLDSKVAQSLIQANELLSIAGESIYEYLLNFANPERRNDGRLSDKELRRYEHCTDGGWWFGSVSVRTGEPTDYGCFKPDNPRENPEDGKPIKYESPLGSKPQLLAFKIPPEIWQKVSERYLVPIGYYTNFYQWLFDHPQIIIDFTEGVKKIGCLLSMGYAAIGVAGVTHCYQKDENGQRRLHPDLAYFANGNRTFRFNFDCDPDKKTRKDVHKIIRRTAGLIVELNESCRVFKVSWNGAKGVDDFVRLNGSNCFQTQVKRAKLVMPIASDWEDGSEWGSKGRNAQKSENDIKFDHIRNTFDDLRFNELTKGVELDGAPLKDLDLVYLDEQIRRCPRHIGKQFAQDAVLKIAKDNSYHPVKDYLDSLESSRLLSEQEWCHIAKFCLGVTDTLSHIILRRFLISCVARIYQPGCYVRLVPILKGNQNIGKSTFWQILTGKDFFTGSLGSLANIKDDYMTLHSKWICEWGEIDRVTRKREADEIKAFLTQTSDDFRPPYGRATERHDRMTLIVGTTNRGDFLKDPTGNTRYGIIEIQNVLDLEKLRANRDRIWATARQAYLAGEQWTLTREEEALSEPNNRRYEEEHPWLETIDNFISQRNDISINEILGNCLEIEHSRRSARENRIVADILRRLGWVQDPHPTRTLDGRVRLWHPPTSPPDIKFN